MDAREVYELQLERAHLRAMRAILAQSGDADRDRAASADQRLAEIDADIEHATTGGEPGPMDRLADQLALSPVEVDFLWTAVAMVGEPRIAAHAHALIGSEARKGLSPALYATLAQLDGTSSRDLALRLDPAHPLLRLRILEPTESHVNAASHALKASPRLAAHLAGADAIDATVGETGGVIERPAELCYDDRQERALARLAEGLAADHPLLVSVEGPIGSGRRTAVAELAARAGIDAVAVDVRRLPQTSGALEQALGALRRECVLRGAVPVIAEVDDLIEGGPDGGGRMRTLGRILDDFPGVAVVTGSRVGIEIPVSRSLLRVDWPVADTATRQALWTQYLAGDADQLAAELAELALRYRLGAGGIEKAAEAARLIARARGNGSGLGMRDLIDGVRNNIAERLGSLATRVEVKQSWDDLVLSPDILDQVNAVIARVRRAHEVYEDWGFQRKAARGIGVPVLFSGPPGTGKTMVAGIIARELDLELLQVDLSQVVSKWIGETEKQLSKVFDAAEAGHALLLFDEADALFSKRTEVKGSTDRYANLEVNYLLQRVESFGGITVLTTNLETGIDKALKRRLAAHVVFWPPDEDEREELWRRLLDTGSAPVAGDIDLEKLARGYPDMSGANIRNAVLAAAFLASSESSKITQAHLERAARGEYRTMGRVLR
jgi:hypothetical protein